MKKIIFTLITISMLGVMLACGTQKAAKIEKIEEVSAEKNEKEQLLLDLSGHKGDMYYEVTDTYVTDKIDDVTGIVSGSPIYLENENGEIQAYEADELVDSQTGKLSDGCHLFVVAVKVTNVNAVYSEKGEFSNPYTFRADNMTLCYVDEKQNVCMYENVDYYSEKKADDIGWSSYDLEPGESAEYKVGFFIGEYVEDNKNMKYIKVDDLDRLMLSNMTGDPQGQFYQVNWEIR